MKLKIAAATLILFTLGGMIVSSTAQADEGEEQTVLIDGKPCSCKFKVHLKQAAPTPEAAREPAAKSVKTADEPPPVDGGVATVSFGVKPPAPQPILKTKARPRAPLSNPAGEAASAPIRFN